MVFRTTPHDIIFTSTYRCSPSKARNADYMQFISWLRTIILISGRGRKWPRNLAHVQNMIVYFGACTDDEYQLGPEEIPSRTGSTSEAVTPAITYITYKLHLLRFKLRHIFVSPRHPSNPTARILTMSRPRFTTLHCQWGGIHPITTLPFTIMITACNYALNCVTNTILTWNLNFYIDNCFDLSDITLICVTNTISTRKLNLYTDNCFDSSDITLNYYLITIVWNLVDW